MYDLSDRVAWLEEHAKGPKVFGFIDYRIGWAGDEVVSANYQFDNLTAKVGVEGQVTNDLMGRVALKVRNTSDMGRAWYGAGNSASPSSNEMGAVDGYSAESIWLDEACLMFPTKKLLKADWVWGRQFVNYGLGLLVNNSRQSQDGVRAKFDNVWNTNLDFDLFVGAAEYDWANGYDTSDGYLAAMVSYEKPSWKIAGEYLDDGYGFESGWAIDFWTKFWGRELYAQYAQLTDSRLGADMTNLSFSTPEAVMAMVDVWKGKNWNLRGYYSSVDAGYDVWYSTINPYYEDYRGMFVAQNTNGGNAISWERWLRNPIAITNVEAIGGQLQFNLANLPFEIAYYSLDSKSSYWAMSPLSALDYDELFSIRTSKKVADGVEIGLTYAIQGAASAGTGMADQDLLAAEVRVGF